jgi:hypothetical protein
MSPTGMAFHGCDVEVSTNDVVVLETLVPQVERLKSDWHAVWGYAGHLRALR